MDTSLQQHLQKDGSPKLNKNSIEYKRLKALCSNFINSIYQGISLKEYLNNKSHLKTKQKMKEYHSIALTQSNTTSSRKTNVKSKGNSSGFSEIRTISFLNKSNEGNKNLDPVIEAYKVSNETEKKKRLYEEKAKAMQNRLNALKKQEESLIKKMNALNSKDRELELIRTDKEAFRKALNSIKEIKSKKLQEKQRRNNQEKDRLRKGLRESLSQLKVKKQAEYDIARTEKQLVTAMISDNIEQIGSSNQRKIEKIKTDHERFKEEEQKKQKENEMKMKMHYIDKSHRNTDKANELKAKIEEMQRLEENYVTSLESPQKLSNAYHFDKEAYSTKISVNVSLNERYMKKILSSKNSIDNANNNTIDNEKSINYKVKKNHKAKVTKLTKEGFMKDRSMERAHNTLKPSKKMNHKGAIRSTSQSTHLN